MKVMNGTSNFVVRLPCFQFQRAGSCRSLVQESKIPQAVQWQKKNFFKEMYKMSLRHLHQKKKQESTPKKIGMCQKDPETTLEKRAPTGQI